MNSIGNVLPSMTLYDLPISDETLVLTEGIKYESIKFNKAVLYELPCVFKSKWHLAFTSIKNKLHDT